MRDIPNWMILAALGIGGFIVWKKVQAFKNAAGNAGAAASESVFNFLHPALQDKAAFQKPVTLAPDANGNCPPGYALRQGAKGYYCLAVN